jgi:Histidine kinase
MAIPSHLQCERDKLRQFDTGGRAWWVIRIVITAGLLNGPFLKLVGDAGPWGLCRLLAMLAASLLLWRAAAWLYESERRRIERKVGSGVLAGWRGAVPMVFVAAGFVLGIRPNLFVQTTVLPFVIFAVLALVMEQSLAAKRASFDLLEAREQVLRAKLAPHFIFNTLNTLHAQIERDPRGAQATAEHLAQLFRQVIEAADLVSIPLKQELAFVEAYLGIEQARLGDRLRVAIEVPEDLEASPVPPLSLQVLVENAIKHGVAPLEGGGEVRIGAERAAGVLHLWVEDPGPGFSPHRGTGTALETLRQRLERPGDLEMGLVEGRHRVGFRWRQA